jgi:hypothetical protein
MLSTTPLGIGTRGGSYKGQGWPLVKLYKTRVTADGGYYEGVGCLLNKLNNL